MMKIDSCKDKEKEKIIDIDSCKDKEKEKINKIPTALVYKIV